MAPARKNEVVVLASQYPYLVGIKGKCAAQIDGCPTTFACGFTEENIKKLLEDPHPQSIELSIIVNNACIHRKGQA